LKLAEKLATIHRYGGQERSSAPTRGALALKPLDQQLPGRSVPASEGEYFIAETVRGGDEAHGIHSFQGLASLSGHPLALICRDDELAHLDIGSAVFLDTETTGLGLGVGTYVFLVGLGYFDGESFRVRQYFLRSPSEEAPFLDALSEFLAGFTTLVTFNGKAFDWPLLENRFVLRRRPPPLRDPLHVDLLYPARTLWKRRLASCSLASLESSILRTIRTEEDVPGWMIPSLYFRFQRTGDAAPLRSVFYHNLHDVLSLATLALHVARVVSGPNCGLVEDGLDFFSLGAAYERAGEADLAAWCYNEAAQRSLPDGARVDCLVRLAALQKRQRWWEAALATWDRLMDEGARASLHALVERAKYFEHVQRDYELALDDVEHAVRLLDLWGDGICDGEESMRQALEYRLSRLLDRHAKRRAHGRRQRWANARGESE
jgi:uncharacterized protein YprB with RNaseH-like and TPR domain